MEYYQYEQLSRGQFIRYLVLEPGQDDDPLACSLHESDVGAVGFEAISYVWGTTNRTEDILCNGMRLKITPNLRDALRRVRLPATIRNLWADSICINQDDLKERGHQVALMGQIYSLAEEVLIWLGPDPRNNAKPATTLINDASEMILAIHKANDYEENSFPYPQNNDELMQMDPRWHSVAAIFDSPWFRRGWVLQESGLGKSAALLWGGSQISWESFMRVWRLADRLAGFASPAHPLLPVFNTIRQSLNVVYGNIFTTTHWRESLAFYPTAVPSLSTNYLEMMRDTHSLSLADDRDRIYAFLALARKITQSKFRPETPDYEQSVPDTYLNFARKYLLDTTDLSLLHYVYHDLSSISENVASWCPRWNLNPFDDYVSCPWYPLLQSSTSPPPPTHFLPRNVLQTRGVIVDVIEACSDPLTREATIEDISLLWKDWRARWNTCSPYGLRLRLVAFIGSLTHGRITLPPDLWHRDFVAYLSEVVERSGDPEIPGVLQSSQSIPVGEKGKIASFVGARVHNRKAVITKRGYYGSVPGISQAGDVVAIIFGTRTPFILRRLRTKDGSMNYKVVGEAWVPSKRSGFDCHTDMLIPLMLGHKLARDWEDWGQQEEDILLV